MPFERLDLQIDPEILVNDFEKFIKPHEPVLINPYYGGWSLTSSSGSYRDGWAQQKNIDASSVPSNLQVAKEWMKEKSIKPNSEHRHKTELCKGIFSEIIDQLTLKNLCPCRARIIFLSPQCSTIWHRDWPEGLYFVRGHIPIITNDNCFFEYEDESMHFLPDGGLYLIRGDRLHRAVNFGKSIRIHFVCDIYDYKGNTKYHKINFAETVPSKEHQ